MTIVPLIQRIVKNRFGTYFNGIESFYLKNFLILIQGLLSKDHASISAIAADENYHIARTTLTRFLQSHESFWSTLKSLVLSLFNRDMEEPPEESSRYSRILIIDDTLVTRRGKKIPFASRQYDHCDNRFTHGQIILAIGEIENKTFQPLDMLFSKSSEEERGSSGSKIDMVLSWLKHNEVRRAVVIADSWYNNAPLIESCKQWFDSDFIGQLKSNVILCVDGQAIKAGKFLSDSTMNRSMRLGGKTIHYHSYLAHILSIRILVKIVVTELFRYVLGTCGDFPRWFPSRPFESDSDEYRYAAFQREDHPILFPPMVDRIFLQIRKTEPFSIQMSNTLRAGAKALYDPCIHRLSDFQ